MSEQTRQLIDGVCVLVDELSADRVQGSRKLPANLCWLVLNVHILGRVPQLCASMIATKVRGRLRLSQSVIEFIGSLVRSQQNIYRLGSHAHVWFDRIMLIQYWRR